MGKVLTLIETVKELETLPVESHVIDVNDTHWFIDSKATAEKIGIFLPIQVLRWGKNMYPSSFKSNLPTMEELSREEQLSCIWMQADLADGQTGVIIRVIDDRCSILFDDGYVESVGFWQIVPRPDLQKLQWPKYISAKQVTSIGQLVDSPDGSIIIDAKGTKVIKQGTKCIFCGGSDRQVLDYENTWLTLAHPITIEGGYNNG